MGLKSRPHTSDDPNVSDVAPSVFRSHDLDEVVWSISGRSSGFTSHLHQ
jgi:hypothetical protein